MKFLFLFLLFLSLSLEVSAQDAVHSYKYVWGDFRGFNETAQTKGFTMGTAKLDPNGHILLDKNTVSFSFDGTAVRPSLADNKPFCIGLTFEANSFPLSSDSLFNLFSGQFNADKDGGTPLDMNITYNGNTTGAVSFGSSTGQLTSRIASAKDLTVFISHDKNDVLTISFHSGTEFITSVAFDGFTIKGGDLESFLIGDANSSMVLKGLGIMVGDSINDSWQKDYFKTVGVQSAPEPGAAILALWGGVFVLCRRRRRAA